eukprot:6506973-Ditylum_brightwellii.AAC.1
MKRLPKTVVELFITHHALRLNELVKVDKRHWKGNVRTAYSKHQYVYEKVHMRSLSIGSEFRRNGQEKMMQAAELLDDE